MDKKQFAEYVINSVRALSVTEILATRMNLVRKGGYHKGLCPFHNDKKIGSFIATEPKGIWKCFSCGVGGDAIKFISLHDGHNYLESAFTLALNHGIISDREYREYYEKRRYSQDQIKNIEKQYEVIDKERFKNDIADDETLDKVFTLFLDTIREHYKANDTENNYHGILSKEHKQHLLEERCLTEKEIEEGCFFTFPTRAIRQRFGKAIREAFDGDEHILAKIPGFYKEKNKPYYTFAYHRGIGIGIKNAVGQIIGIQIRHDAKDEDKSRYVWFSSSFASFDEKFECGTSSGSPVDVVYPETLKSSTVFITEGRFKALKIAKETGSIALSVQGVSTWKGVVKELEQIPDAEIMKTLCPNRRFSVNCVLVSFDADMNYNHAVFTQARKMADYLQQKGYAVYYLNWDDELGKGIDDIINNGHKNEIKRYEKEIWDKQYDYMIKTLLDEVEKKTCDMVVYEMLMEDMEKDKKGKKTYKEMKDIPAEIVKYYFRKMMNITPLATNAKSQMHQSACLKKIAR